MSRQALRWVAMGLLVVVLVVTFVNLGRWQLDRLEQRRDRNSAVVAHEHEPVRPYAEVMTGVVEDDDQWYRVTATGTYEPEQFQVRYRSLDGAYGSEIVGVLRTDDGNLLLVNRGFLPREAGYPDGEMPPVMTGAQKKPPRFSQNSRLISHLNAPGLEGLPNVEVTAFMRRFLS